MIKIGGEKVKRVSITLPPEMLADIKLKVQSESYGSTSEVIREAMRLLQRKEEEYEARLSLIRKRLERAAIYGTPVPIDQAFEEIEHFHQQQVAMAHEDL